MDQTTTTPPRWKRVLMIATEVLLIAIVLGLIFLIVLPVFIGSDPPMLHR